MADKYSTIQQHQPLRVPESFGSQGKMFVVQLDEIFDDIYRRFGRIRLEDLGDKLVQEIKDKYGNVNGIYITEDGIDIESNIGDTRHIRLQSGNSVILIDPSQINMNTDGFVSILGRGDSIIRLVGGGTDDQTIFQADATGVVEAKSVESETITAGTLNVTDLNVLGDVTGDFHVPNILISTTKPAAGNNTIWIEPNSSTVEPFSRSRTVSDCTVSGWSQSGSSLTWTQTKSLSSSMNGQGTKKVKIAGKLYRNGNTRATASSLSARLNLSNGDTVSLGTVGTFAGSGSLKWDYSFSSEKSRTITANANIDSVTYTFEVTNDTGDYLAYYSYPHDVKLTITGETGSSGSSDECTVHYIP